MDRLASELSATTTSQRRLNLVVVLDDQLGDSEGGRSTCLELYSHLIDDNDLQLTYFSSGVGAYSHPRTTSRFTKLKRTINQYADHLFASSIEKRIKAAYQWLSKEYRDGDRIFLFGLSRGAWAVKALASMIDIVGLIKPDNEEQIPSFHPSNLNLILSGSPRSSRTSSTSTVWSVLYHSGSSVLSVTRWDRPWRSGRRPHNRLVHLDLLDLVDLLLVLLLNHLLILYKKPLILPRSPNLLPLLLPLLCSSQHPPGPGPALDWPILNYAYDLFRAYQGPEFKGPKSNPFKSTFSREVTKIHFVGTFDTIRPPMTFLGFKSLPWIGEYNNIEHVRHAVAIDENHSRFHRPELYHLEGNGMPPDTRVKEVWFRGTHLHLGKSWTGGGFAPLTWMEWESMSVGLKFKADVPLGWDHWGSWTALRIHPLVGRKWLASWIREALSRPLSIHQPRSIPIGATLHISVLYAPEGGCSALDVDPWKTLLLKGAADLPKRPPPGETTYIDFECLDPDYPALDYLCDEPVFEMTDEALKTACVLSGFLNLRHRSLVQEIPQGVIDWALTRMLRGSRLYWGKGGWEDIDPWSNSRRENAASSCFGAITQTHPKAFWTFLETHPEVWKVDPINTRQLCLSFTHTLKSGMYENRRINADGTTIFIPPDGINITFMWNRILDIWDRTGPGFPGDHWDSEDIFEALQRLAPFCPDLIEKDGPRIRDAVAKRRRIFENMARFNPERTYQALKWMFPVEGGSPDIRRIILDVVDSAHAPDISPTEGFLKYRQGDFGPNCFNAGLWKVVARMRSLPDPWDQPDWKTEEQAAEILIAAKASESS